MKKTHLLLLCLFSLQFSLAQHKTEVDTLDKTAEGLYVTIRTYHNDTLIEEGTAFLFPVSLPSSGGLFGRTRYVPADSVVWHGTLKEYDSFQRQRVTQYQRGKKIKVSCYDKEGKPVEAGEFRNEKNLRGGTPSGRYLISGTKKNRKK